MPPKNESPKEAPAAPECPECANKDAEIERLKKLATEAVNFTNENAELLLTIGVLSKKGKTYRQQ